MSSKASRHWLWRLPFRQTVNNRRKTMVVDFFSQPKFHMTNDHKWNCENDPLEIFHQMRNPVFSLVGDVGQSLLCSKFRKDTQLVFQISYLKAPGPHWHRTTMTVRVTMRGFTFSVFISGHKWSKCSVIKGDGKRKPSGADTWIDAGARSVWIQGLENAKEEKNVQPW